MKPTPPLTRSPLQSREARARDRKEARERARAKAKKIDLEDGPLPLSVVDGDAAQGESKLAQISRELKQLNEASSLIT